MNTGVPPERSEWANGRVLAMQTKLHQWAAADGRRRFGDVFNLVHDEAFLIVAWEKVRTNKGARSAGVDGIAPVAIPPWQVPEMLAELKERLRTRTYVPRPVRQVEIPKANGKRRKLGIPPVVDRIVQASLKLVLEPVFEADFDPCSYGFRPRRGTRDAIAEIRHLASEASRYHVVFEGDIEACFDKIGHGPLMNRIARRIKDKRALDLIRALLKAGIMRADDTYEGTITGAQQGGNLSPLLANIALSVLDEHFRAKWEALGGQYGRQKHRRAGGSCMRLVRYCDDFVVMIYGQRHHAEELREEVQDVLATMGLNLSDAKTKITDVDEGFDFLGWHIQRRQKRGAGGRKVLYIYPSKKALLSVMGKIRTLTRRNRHRTLRDLLMAINPVLRGWCNYFRYGVSSQTFAYLGHYTFWRVFAWLAKRHRPLSKRALVDRFMPGWTIAEDGIEMFKPQTVAIIRYHWKGYHIPNPWQKTGALA